MEQIIHDLEKSGLTLQQVEKYGVKVFNGNEAELKAKLHYSHFEGNAILQVCKLLEFSYHDENGKIFASSFKLYPSLKEVKYLHPSNTPARPYLLPDVWAVKDKSNKSIWITEGEKKTLKLLVEERFAIGFSGVWNFKAGKDSSLDNEKDLWDDLLRFDWQGRTVFIGFDADLWTNPQVRMALWELAFKLYSKGSIIKFPIWDKSEGKGIDDFLAHHQREGKKPKEVLDLLEKTAKSIDQFICSDHKDALIRALCKVHLSPIEYEGTIRTIARKLRVPEKAVKKEINEKRNIYSSDTSGTVIKPNASLTSSPVSGVSFSDVENTINKWLFLEDKGVIKTVIGTVIANRLPGDPVWLFLVSSSGGAKTELIRGLNKVDFIYHLSELTPQTFVSGDKGNKKASLLLRLPIETILTLKDFTTILSMHRDNKQAILSQLREIYDGYYRKEFGTGESVTWQGKLGFIAGVTPILDTHYSVSQVLGERFVQYKLKHNDEITLVKKAINNRGKEAEMREEISGVVANFLNPLKIPPTLPTPPEELKERINYLSIFCVRARSGVIRDSFYTREVDLIPDPELPTRFPKQLLTLAVAFSLINGGEFSDDDYHLLYKIGLDSIPQKRRLILEILKEVNDYLETAEIAGKIGYPTNTTRRTLEDLHGLKLLDREHLGTGHADSWVLNEKYQEYLSKFVPPVIPLNSKPVKVSTTLPEMSDECTTTSQRLSTIPQEAEKILEETGKFCYVRALMERCKSSQGKTFNAVAMGITGNRYKELSQIPIEDCLQILKRFEPNHCLNQEN